MLVKQQLLWNKVMKANELMIGDIVRVAKDVCIPKGTIVSIKGIDEKWI